MNDKDQKKEPGTEGEASGMSELLSVDDIKSIAELYLENGLHFGRDKIYRCTLIEIIKLVRDVESIRNDELNNLELILNWANYHDEDAESDDFSKGYDAARSWVRMFNR